MTTGERILVVSKGRSGGAGIAAWRWHNALVDSGFNSIFIDEEIVENDFGKKLHLKFGLIKFINRLLLHLTSITGHTPFGPFSFDYFSTSAEKKILELTTTNHDIINLHWINSGFLSLKGILKMSNRVPVIWTAHDAWLLNGIAHYEIPGFPKGIRRLLFYKFLDGIARKRKRKLLLSASGVVTPSHWLKNGFIESGVAEQEIRVIPNPVPFEFFHPLNNRDSIEFKSNKSIPSNSLLIGFISAGSLKDSRKGFDLLENAILELDKGLRSKIVLVIAGRSFKNEKIASGIQFIYYGEVIGNEKLNIFYNLCDLVVVPSRMDNLPQTATEAQSSGCPVLINDVGGCSETISNGKSGWLFNGGVDDLNLKLADLIRNPSKLSVARIEAALFARETWDKTKLVDSYRRFQEEILTGKNSG